ncbi:PLP-dependent aminotransferase family protein [Streptomyces albidoflavus]|uniref:MocR-like pyridoxine biosynthesis transcription factor PdxR n=1 Tax=Streptomyces TaxID=1883 RepID=UPI001164179A|nr:MULTISPECIES: PLP-dependent aminotransferase family protein [unclassified Streptomyces]MBL0779708.1 PLP-dependent aminotransferase family protein [Streptomyces albidoflavus]MCG5118938.1 PLP-dependent aminotransferase family protein [Streptomyces sp. T7(2022)]MCQ9705444.1 PLP-dependent aminotransferase family protein [Streptomyces sp. BSP1]QDD60447.1 PLP-dependent aminotransferase family protein [Streptomyces albidoflavus]
MTESWANLGIDLHLEPAGPGLRKGLTDALREAVRSGRLAPGTRLPSSRTLAGDLGIARNTVADAYADLVAEGHLTARQGSGTRVAEQAGPAASVPRRQRPVRVPERAGPAHDLTPGTPDLSAFPRAAWLKAARRALTAAPNDAFGYGDPRGRPELRAALAEYLARVRGVAADPERIVVCAGVAHGLKLVTEVLAARAGHGGRQGPGTVAVETYGLRFHREWLAEEGVGTVPLPFDAEGTDPAGLGGERAVLLTPTHQFPMGGTLSPARRAAVVDWARRTGGLILEDDYDGEFRHDRRPVGALQGLAPDRVAYFGTASKALAPGLRLGWLVLPPGLVDEVLAAKGYADTCGAPDQLTLAEFLSSGAYDRQVRLMRLRYRRRRDEMVATLARRAPSVRVGGIAAGLHAVLLLPSGTESEVLRAAAWHGLGVQGLSWFRHPDAEAAGRPAPEGLVIGYGRPPDHAWQSALETLCRCLP